MTASRLILQRFDGSAPRGLKGADWAEIVKKQARASGLEVVELAEEESAEEETRP